MKTKSNVDHSEKEKHKQNVTKLCTAFNADAMPSHNSTQITLLHKHIHSLQKENIHNNKIHIYLRVQLTLPNLWYKSLEFVFEFKRKRKH